MFLERKRIYITPPIHPMYILILLFLSIFMPILVIIFLGSTTLAFTRLGLSPEVGFLIVLASIFGSLINIKVAELVSYETVIVTREVNFFGIRYLVPTISLGERITVLAVNVGGCIIPVLVSFYVIFRILQLSNYDLFLKALVGILIATIIFKLVARPIKGVGIAMPFLTVLLFV